MKLTAPPEIGHFSIDNVIYDRDEDGFFNITEAPAIETAKMHGAVEVDPIGSSGPDNPLVEDISNIGSVDESTIVDGTTPPAAISEPTPLLVPAVPVPTDTGTEAPDVDPVDVPAEGEMEAVDTSEGTGDTPVPVDGDAPVPVETGADEAEILGDAMAHVATGDIDFAVAEIQHVKDWLMHRGIAVDDSTPDEAVRQIASDTASA